MCQGRGVRNVSYTPQWASQRLLLGCLFILLLGVVEQFHEPHFASLHQADESVHSHSTQYSIAPLPAKLRIRNDSLKRHTEDELLKALELSSSDMDLPSATLTLDSMLNYKPVLNRVASNDTCSCHAVLPPNRAPPSYTAS
ncbi:hypothetical protein LCGC14_0035770 [marine sediment metagenome]|uniref:Uncharacterized protein n=1 Tax=marine sediment metagenome TaxID=412755 RepID=A0A0F9VVZ0_9ZZZZ